MLKRLIPAIAWFSLSLFLLCLPGSNIPKYPWFNAIYGDKWVHIFLFGVLCFLFCRAWLTPSRSATELKKGFLLILLSGIVYGTIMEFVQKYWIPNRSFEILDIMADSTGCLIAYLYSCKKWGKA